MKKLILASLLSIASAVSSWSQEDITIHKEIKPGETPPVWVNVSGVSGEALQVLEFDLYVQGFNFTNADSAQYLIAAKANGNFEGRVTDRISKHSVLAKAYSGATLRRQVHKFVDDFTTAFDANRKPICQTQVAFKGQSGSHSEIFISDFDGHNATAITQDGSIVSAPAWVHGRMAIYYGTYKLNHADIAYHDILSKQRHPFASFGGSNMSPAPSPDGSKVAMILSKDGWTDLYVSPSGHCEPFRLTKSPQDESSPCWSPDGHWICYASKEREHRALQKISASGGSPQTIRTVGVLNPTEPDWSPDGKWIAFTAQMGSFRICVVPADGSKPATELCEGEDPTWSPNSRTLMCARRTGSGYVLQLLDVPTKQVKDVSRISGSSSQSQPSWAR